MAIALGGDARIHSAIGASVHNYSHVESAQVDILEALLTIKTVPASILLHSVQNARSRNAMIQGLLRHYHADKFKTFWTGCSEFLSALALYRNAIVHWHPHINIYVAKKGGVTRSANAIGNPMYGRGSKSLELEDFAPFDADCGYIREILLDFGRFLKTFKPDDPLPDKFSRPTIRPNRAVLQQRQTAKAPQPLRPPSVPKLSAEQKLAKAKKEAREKRKR